MFTLDRSQTVALLIDYDNLQICAQRDAPGSELDLRSVVALAQRFGTVVVARAYAEWNNPTERLDAYKAGIEPAFAPVLRTERGGGDGKSLADTVMVADGVDLMWTHAPSVFVLVTSDKDMIPLARLVKQRGARLVVVGSDLTAVPLRELADEFFTYRRIVQEVTGVLVGGGGGQPAARAGAAQRPQRHPPAPRERAAPPPPPAPAPPVPAPTPAPPAPIEEHAAPLEPVAVGAAAAGMAAAGTEAGQEERPGQPGARRRRRRGGRGRNRGGPLGPGEPGSAEALVAVDEIGANGAVDSEPGPEVAEAVELSTGEEALEPAGRTEALAPAPRGEVLETLPPGEALELPGPEAVQEPLIREEVQAPQAPLPAPVLTPVEEWRFAPPTGRPVPPLAERLVSPSAETPVPTVSESPAPVAEEGQEAVEAAEPKPPVRRRRPKPKPA